MRIWERGIGRWLERAVFDGGVCMYNGETDTQDGNGKMR